MTKPNILKFCFDKTVKSQRSKAIDKAALKFIKAVEDATTYDEVLSLAPSYENLSKAILSMESSKYFAKLIISELRFTWLLKIKLIQQTK